MNESYKGLFATDFDGTLLTFDKRVLAENYRALEKLSERRVMRVIATGRSLYSLSTVITDTFPVEYVVFSSGAGVMRVDDRMVLMSREFDEKETAAVAEYLLEASVDFMIHHPIPENHRFYYHHSGKDNEDFFRRRDHYSDHAEPYEKNALSGLRASQFLIVDPRGAQTVERIESALGERVSVIRATSPLDHESVWIEIFPPKTNKAAGLEWISLRHEISRKDTAAAGNDYNDLHMLEWASRAFVVSNAPRELRERYRTVASCDEGGLAEAVALWLEEFEGEQG